jgi:hypothetical protein
MIRCWTASLSLCFVTSFCSSRSASAGPWLAGAGHGYVQLREGFSFADSRFDAGGSTAAVKAVTADGSLVVSAWRLLETSLFAELGLLSRLSLMLDWTVVRSAWQPQPGAAPITATGLSDLALALKVLLFDDVVTLSLVGGVTAPVGDATARLPLGQGDTRTELAVCVGKLFRPTGFFVDAQLGFVLRGGARVRDARMPTQIDAVDYRPEARFLAEGGFNWLLRRRGVERLVFSLRLDGRYATGVASEDGLGILTPASSSFLRVGGGVSWLIVRHFEVGLSVASVVTGHAIPALTDLGFDVAVPY